MKREKIRRKYEKEPKKKVEYLDNNNLRRRFRTHGGRG